MAKTKTAKTTNPAARTFATKNGLAPDVRTEMVALLNQQLADTLDLFSQTKQAHWNVKGPDVYQLHLMFDAHAASAAEWSDLLAERAVMLGGYATGTVRMSAASSTLPEFPTDITDSLDYVRATVERWAAYANSTRDAIDTADEAGDATTADLFTEISGGADKWLWMVEAHLQGR
jgi:starvation-inducible DNA-binding protein